jgi:hypothetical protein
MTDAAGPANDGQRTAEQAALADASAAANGAAVLPVTAPVGPDAAALPVAADRPELVVGAAFAGGLALALLLKRLAR